MTIATIIELDLDKFPNEKETTKIKMTHTIYKR